MIKHTFKTVPDPLQIQALQEYLLTLEQACGKNGLHGLCRFTTSAGWLIKHAHTFRRGLQSKCHSDLSTLEAGHKICKVHADKVRLFVFWPLFAALAYVAGERASVAQGWAGQHRLRGFLLPHLQIAPFARRAKGVPCRSAPGCERMRDLDFARTRCPAGFLKYPTISNKRTRTDVFCMYFEVVN